MFETEGGNLVSIEEGVAEELPDNLKPARMDGGSGSQTGSPKLAARRSELEKLKKEYSAAKQAFRQDGGKSDAALAKVHETKQRIVALEAELKG